MIAAEHAPECRDPAERVVLLEHAMTLDAAIQLGTDPERIGQAHLEPARHTPRLHAIVEQLAGAAQQAVDRVGAAALLDGTIGELAEVPGRGRGLEPVAQAQPGVSHPDLRDDIEVAAAREDYVELREGFDAATDAAPRAAHALGHSADLAVLGREQRDDAIGLAQIEVGEDDGASLVGTGSRHGASLEDEAPARRPAVIGQCATGAYHVAVLTAVDLDRLIADTEQEMLGVIERAEDERTAELYEMVRYHMGLDSDAPRGKRMRPLLGLLVYQSITGDHARALPGAAAVEMGHNFSLVHDDIEDNGAERRHRPALWRISGVPQAINTGDTLFTLSRMALYRLEEEGFDDSRILRLMRLYDETCLALCEGQFMDIWMSEHDEWMSVDYYFDMIGRKTASLIAGSAEAGAMLATDDETVIAACRRFGWALGLAFQLNDDLLGVWGDEATTGKETSDIVTRKKTLPLSYALAEATGADGERLQAILAQSGADPSPDEVQEVLDILERVGAQEYTRGRARAYRDEALAEIASVGLVDEASIERLGDVVRAAISA